MFETREEESHATRFYFHSVSTPEAVTLLLRAQQIPGHVCLRHEFYGHEELNRFCLVHFPFSESHPARGTLLSISCLVL